MPETGHLAGHLSRPQNSASRAELLAPVTSALTLRLWLDADEYAAVAARLERQRRADWQRSEELGAAMLAELEPERLAA